MKDLSSRLKHRVTIEEPVYTSDLLGGFVTAWNAKATVWAEIIPQVRGDQLNAEKIDSMNYYKITLRYIPNINTKMRLKNKGKYYLIKSVINVGESGERLEILASDEVK